MRVTIRLFANFRIGRFKEETRDCDSTSTVRQIVEDLGIADAEVGIIFINGRNAVMDQALRTGILSPFSRSSAEADMPELVSFLHDRSSMACCH